jgi:uncharacterized membrane protein
MYVLVIGLVMFLGVHMLQVIPGLRSGLQARLGAGHYKIAYTAVSLTGFGLIIWGKILAHPTAHLWSPPEWTRMAALFAVPVALILLVSAYAPGHIRHHVRHPMLAGIAVWAGAHLAANSELSAIVLFGSFLVWAVITFISSWMRETAPPVVKGWGGDLTAIVLGFLAAMIILRFHLYLFGVGIL